MRGLLAAHGCFLLGALVFWGAVIYAVAHFLLKFW